MSDIAVLGATSFELEELAGHIEEGVRLRVAGRAWTCGKIAGRGVRLVETGMGAVNAAHALTCALQQGSPDLVLQVGVGGAYEGSGLGVGDVAVADEEVYGDLGVRTPEGWQGAEAIGIPVLECGGTFFNRFPLDSAWVERVEGVLEDVDWGGRVRVGRGAFVTVQECSGTTALGREREALFGALCENMEGAAAAHVCRLYGVPFVEVRGISNRVEDRDRSRWDLRGAARRAQRAGVELLRRIEIEES